MGKNQEIQIIIGTWLRIQVNIRKVRKETCQLTKGKRIGKCTKREEQVGALKKEKESTGKYIERRKRVDGADYYRACKEREGRSKMSKKSKNTGIERTHEQLPRLKRVIDEVKRKEKKKTKNKEQEKEREIYIRRDSMGERFKRIEKSSIR